MKTTRPLIILLAASTCATAVAQVSPVSVAEANAVINKMDAGIRKALHLKPGTQLPLTESKPITRAQVVLELDKVFESYRPYFQYTPRPLRVETAIIAKFNPDLRVQKSLHKLVKFGFTGTVAPLVVGPGDNMSIGDFADAMGFFAAQVAALTYFADPLWVPNIQRNDSKDG